jgi:hypothetical protein
MAHDAHSIGRSPPENQPSPFSVAAYGYASMGAPVFPLSPRDKVPFKGTRGCLEATTDHRQIDEWVRQYPGANIGIATGSWCCVLDVDGPEGLATLAEWEDLNRWLPEGPASMTGSGGAHYLFNATCRIKNSTKRLGPGLDTRGAGGYIVAPPSVHPNGSSYHWLSWRPLSPALPDAPGWLLELLDPPEPERPPAPKPPRAGDMKPYVRTAFDRELNAVAGSGRGQRNHTLNTAAFNLGRFIVEEDVSETWLADILLKAALSCGLSEREAKLTIASGLRAAIRGAA